MNLKVRIEEKLQTICPGATLSVSDKADFQCNAAFNLAKARHETPTAVATNIVTQWNDQFSDLATASVAGGFINFVVSPAELQAMAEFIFREHALPLPQQPQRTIFLDYGGANIAKELHIGHLRSPIIGEALKRTFQAFGHKTIAGTYLGDWGLQMGLVIASLIEQNIPVEKVTLEMLGEIYPAAAKRKNTDPEFYARAATITARLQNLDEPYCTMWHQLRDLSVRQIRKNYERLNCTFDLYDGESSYQANVQPVLQKLQAARVLRQSQGALIVDVSQPTDNKPMPPIILKKQNGGDLYATSDVAALDARYQKYAPDQFIYITDARQALHFEQVFRTARLGHLVPAETILTHIGYGTINGQDGKPFKTRDGGTIKLEDIMTTVADATTEFAVGVAAIKFADLINNVRKDYIFDLQKCTSFEGKTGPYILYTIVRINSLLQKAHAAPEITDFACLSQHLTPEMRDILNKIIKLTEAYNVVVNTLSLHPLAEAIYNLANSFSIFYATHNILNEPNLAKHDLMLALAQLTKTALEIGLHTLAIDPVEKM